VVEAVAAGEPEASRALVHESSLANFSEGESADGRTTTTSFESPSSERIALLQRLSEAEEAVQLLPEEPADEGQPESAIDMEAVRQQATADAIEDARRLHRQQAYYEPPPPNSIEAQLAEIQQGLERDFSRRMAAVRPPDIDQLMAEAVREGTDVSAEVRDTLMTLDGGPQATIFLLRHPEERQRLNALPPHIAQGYVGHLAARLAAPPRRARSNAPEPISPVGGSSTRSSLPPDQMDYQTTASGAKQELKPSAGGEICIPRHTARV
jgi:hypothetical protein